MQVTVVDGNNVTVSLDRGVAGVGIASISLVVINQANYLLITYTNGTTQTVGPVGVIQYNATTPINISGSTISLLTVPVNLGGTGQTTAAAGLNALLPAQASQANKYLQTDGTNASWDAVSLSTADITGILPVANGGTGVSTSTGTGNTVLSTSPTLVTPVLGTPASGTLTNATGLPVATGISGLGTGVATFLATPSSANLAAALTDETGTGAAVFATSPTLVTPALGTPASGVMTNVTGTAAGLTAGNVTTNANLTGGVTSVGNAATVITNANLTGDITSIGNATTLTNAPVIAKVLTGYISGAGTVAATDSILQAIQKLDGNNSTNANLTGPITSVGNVTSIASQTGTGTKFVVDTSPTLITPDLGTPTALVGTNITGTALSFTSSNVTTNANLTGDVTSVGNATAIAAGVIVNADINASAAIDDTKLATIATALKVSNSATTAASANTASAIVARDASGDFTAGTVTAALTGNSSTATALATGRTIEITGDLAYTSPSFDGSANVTAAGTLATVATAGVTGSSTAIPVVTINAKGLTTSITTAVVIAPAGTLSGSTLAAGVTGSSLTSLGTIANLSVTAGTISTTPSASTDIANKDYVDTVAQGLDPKASCVAATTVNITLSGTQTIDGVALIAADRCLVKDQTAPADNGIYVVAAGAWARSADMNAWLEVPGAFTFIEQGTTQADTGWVCTSNAGGTLGTTAITFVQFAGAGSYTASTGLTLTGTAFSLTAPVTVALGGTNATSAGITAFNNISGFTAAGATGTTSTNLVFSTSPTLVTPILGTPQSATLTNATDLPLTTGVTGTLPVANGGTGLTAGTSGGVLTYTAAGTLASSTELAASALVIGGGAGAAPSTTTTGTGVVTALGVNTGTAGAFVVNGGALGTPSSGTVTNLTGTASININGTVGATTANTGAFTTLSASENVTATKKLVFTSTASSGSESRSIHSTANILIFQGGTGGYSFNSSDDSKAQFMIADAAVNNAMVLSATGLAVTGTLSSTTGSNFATSSGSVGVGTSSPATYGGFSVRRAVTTVDTTNCSASFSDAANSTLDIGHTSGLVTINAQGGSLAFNAASSERGRFSSTGLAVTGALSATGAGSIQGLTVGLGSGGVGSNTAVGVTALSANASGAANTALGYQALKINTASDNTSIGAYTLPINVGGSSNVAVGSLAMITNVSGSYNVAVGAGINGSLQGALGLNSSGNNNTAIGYAALRSNDTASNNTAVGYQAGYLNQTGTLFTALGYQAGYASVSTNRGTYIGSTSGLATTGAQNTFVGDTSGSLVTIGASNTILGRWDGNFDGLDIRIASNYLVISDGDGNRLLTSALNQTVALQGAVPNAGTGITFPGTQSASTNANTLDDYEEGSFNPTLNCTTNSGTIAYAYQYGYYVKVGQLVWYYFDMSISSHSGASGTPYITMPFVNANLSQNYSTFVPWDVNQNFTGTNVQACGYIEVNGTSLFLFQRQGTSSEVAATFNLNTTGRISGVITYRAAS